MKYMATVVAAALALTLITPAMASDDDPSGVWTKTTHPDPNNISIFYTDGKIVRAIGHGMIANRPAIWYAEGNFQDRQVNLAYRYSTDSTPNGWESEGVMQIRLSEDGNTMAGLAASRSGAWSDRIEFKRIKLITN